MQTTVQTKRVVSNSVLVIFGILSYIATLPHLSYLILLRGLYSGSVPRGIPFNLGFMFLPLNILSYVITIILAIVIYTKVKPSIKRTQFFKALFMIYLTTLVVNFIIFFTKNLLFFMSDIMGYELFILINRFYAIVSFVLLVTTLLVFIIGLFGIVKPQFSNTSLLLGLIFILLMILSSVLSIVNLAVSIDQHFRMMINIVYLNQINILIKVFFLASLKTYKITEEKNTNDVFSTDFSY